MCSTTRYLVLAVDQPACSVERVCTLRIIISHDDVQQMLEANLCPTTYKGRFYRKEPEHMAPN
jgi:hypothetical protein